MNSSGKLYRIASLNNQATKFLNNLLNNFIQVVKMNKDFLGDISKQSETSSFSSPIRNCINIKRNSSWGFNDAGIFFFIVLFKICMACFGPFQYVICAIYDLINGKSVLNKAADAIPV